MYEPVRLFWEVWLFLFYLFVASSYWLVRSISLTWMLWRTRTMAHPSSDGSDDSLSGAEFLKELALCSLKISAMKRAVVLTLILSALVPIGGAIRCAAFRLRSLQGRRLSPERVLRSSSRSQLGSQFAQLCMRFTAFSKGYLRAEKPAWVARPSSQTFLVETSLRYVLHSFLTSEFRSGTEDVAELRLYGF